MVIDVCVHMHGDCHAMPIGRPEHPTNAGKMLWIVDIHVRIPEVELETSAWVCVLRTALDLFYCIGSQRIDAAETNEAVGIFRNLGASPIVLGNNVRVFVGNVCFVWIREVVRNGKYDSSPDSGRVELRNEVIGIDAFRSWRGSGARFSAVQVLVIVDDFTRNLFLCTKRGRIETGKN